MSLPFLLVSGLIASPAGNHTVFGGYGSWRSWTLYWAGGLASQTSAFSFIPQPPIYCVEASVGWQGGADIAQKACS